MSVEKNGWERKAYTQSSREEDKGEIIHDNMGFIGNFFFNTPEAADAAGLKRGAEHIEINLVLVLSSSSQPSPP